MALNMEGKVSPMTNKGGEQDMTNEEALQASKRKQMEDRLAREEAARKSLEDEANTKKSPEEVKAEINDILKNL